MRCQAATHFINLERRNMMPCMQELLDACERHTLSQQAADESNVVIGEAYVPYIPPQWNRCLVLAEAQNLSNTNGGYVRRLQGLSSRERMNRFAKGPAVAPWNDGSLPCAIEAAFGLDSCRAAVSNAVPWSRVTSGGANANPTREMEDRAVQFWRDLLPLIEPTLIISAGNVAARVLKRADPEGRCNRRKVRLPSPQAMSRISGMFSVDDLQKRYKEVRRVVEGKPEWFKDHRQNKIFYACHVVSLHGRNDG